jgi:hypothetical protein
VRGAQRERGSLLGEVGERSETGGGNRDEGGRNDPRCRGFIVQIGVDLTESLRYGEKSQGVVRFSLDVFSGCKGAVGIAAAMMVSCGALEQVRSCFTGKDGER